MADDKAASAAKAAADQNTKDTDAVKSAAPASDVKTPSPVVPDEPSVAQILKDHAELLQKQSDVIVQQHEAITSLNKTIAAATTGTAAHESIFQRMHDRLVALENHIKRIGL